MPDEENWIQGNLSDTPFPYVLFRLWQSEKTGFLSVKQGDIKKILGFKDGQIAAIAKRLPLRDFLSALEEKNILNSSLITECENYAEQNKCSLIRAFHDLSLLRPSEIWSLLEIIIKENTLPVFDWNEGNYEFDSETNLPDSQILFLIQTLPFILQGIRQMKNHDAIDARIPGEEAQIQVLVPYYSHQIKLDLPEKYLMTILKRHKNLKTVYEKSELGRKESKKILFAYLCLGLISFPSVKMLGQSRPKPEPLEFDKKLAVFNAKFSCIYKYISKELGPVAFNLVEKCFEELKSHLSPLMKEAKFDSEGRIRINSILKTDIAFVSEETKRDLIRDLNEILVAEVLAVKKNLGDEHEYMLVNILNKIGELV